MVSQSTFKIMILCSIIHTGTKKPQIMYMNIKSNLYYRLYSKKE